MLYKMNNDELLAEISKTLTKKQADELAKRALHSDASIGYLMELSLSGDKKTAFRAAWVLENVLEYNPEHFYPQLDKFIRIFPSQDNRSCQRHYTNILKHPSLQFTLQQFPDNIFEPLVEAVVEWLIDPRSPVAVKANCLDILFDFSRRFDWIKEELAEQIRFLQKDSSAALQVRGKKILRLLAAADSLSKRH